MKLLGALITMSLIGATANASSIDCKTLGQEDGFASLELSDSATELVRYSQQMEVVDRLAIAKVAPNGGSAKVFGGLVLDQPIACAGSCPSTAFELHLTSAEIAPNSKLILTTSGFSEYTGKVESSKIEIKLDCSFSGMKELNNKLVQKPQPKHEPVDPVGVIIPEL